MVLAAVVAQATGNKDAIRYVRKNYCSRAVENSDQVNFLAHHYGITKVSGSKIKHLIPDKPALSRSPKGKKVDYFPPITPVKKGLFEDLADAKEVVQVGGQRAPRTITPMEFSKRSIWRKSIKV